ncbi:MAG: hypothetical protein ACREJ3_09140, partial [Polyangiaceae bacterium]
MQRILGVATLAVSAVFYPSTAHAQGAVLGVSAGGSTRTAAAPPPAPAPAPAVRPAAVAVQVSLPQEIKGAATGGTPNEDAAEEAEAAEWAARDRAMFESNTLTGGTGLLHTQHAESGAPGQFRLGVIGEWFSAGFLCTSTFPCPNPSGGAPITSDTLTHSAASISLGASLFQIGAGTFDAYASTSVIDDSDAANKPSVSQTFGDTNLAVKYMAPVGDVMHLGLFSELWLVQGTNSVGIDGAATSAKFGGIATADLRGLPSEVPLRFSANVVYSLDNTGATLTDAENARGVPVTRIERYSFGVNRVDHFDFLLGGEAFLADERVRPFVETRILAPMNRQLYACNTKNLSHDNCLQYDTVVPATLTIGSRFFPWKRGISLLAALDIGLSGVHDFLEELQPVAPWTLFIGAGLATDTQERPPAVKRVEKIVDRTPARGHVSGFVHEKDKKEPISGAIATYRDHPDMSPLATGADGMFSDEVPLGSYSYDVRADGYRPGSCEANFATAGNMIIDCPLEALPRVGTVIG